MIDLCLYFAEDKVLQLALQEKEDAESVVKELRKHNEALLS